jgi:hypothetical protein
MRRDGQRSRRLRDREILEGGPIPLAPGLIRGRAARAAVGLFEWMLNAYWRIARRAIA